MDQVQMQRVAHGQGFIAALDQSGGSTPKALLEYGISEDSYDGDDQMFDLVHAMRERIATAKSFDGSKIFAAILFEQTMERQFAGIGSAEYLWQEKQIVPFLKIDAGLEDRADGVQRMKPISGIDSLLERAQFHGVVGTKMRSVVHAADRGGIDAVLDQQFAIAHRVLSAGLVPIIEPEVSIGSPEKQAAEKVLRSGIVQRLEALPSGAQVMLKLSIPSVDGFYSNLIRHDGVLRVVALSGGHERGRAAELLSSNPGLSASFSRGLTQGLSIDQTDEQFEGTLGAAVDQIYDASTT